MNEELQDKVEELEETVTSLSKRLDEQSREFEEFIGKINPYNLLNGSLDVLSKVMINQVVRADILSGSITWNPGNLADGVGETSAAITVTDAKLGDFVWFSAPYDLQGITANGYVSAANTVKIRLQNETTGAIDLASGTWNVLVFKKDYII